MIRRRTAVVAFLCVTLLAIGVLGGAGNVQAGPRVISPFTVSVAPAPGELGRRVAYSVFFANASNHPLTHVEFRAAASAGGTFSAHQTSTGTCLKNLQNAAVVDCTYGKLLPGATVSMTLVFNTPAAATNAPKMDLDALVRVNERGGDPGSASLFRPTPNPTVVALDKPSATKLSDVLNPTGGTRQTAPVATAKNTSTKLTVPAVSTFVPVVLEELATDSTVCGAAATPVLKTSSVSAPGTFTTQPLTIVLDLRKGALPPGTLISQIVACHDGVKLGNCPTVGALPAKGCLKSKVPATVGLVQVFRLTMQGPTNGKWGGGLG